MTTAPKIVPLTASHVNETAILRHPSLRRRTELRESRTHAVRHHTGRVATRFAVLLAGDVAAILIAQAVAIWLAETTARGAEAFGGTPFLMGGARFVIFGVITLVSVFATGGHSRHRALNQPIRLFVAAAGAVLLNWAGGIARGLLPDLLLRMVATVAVTWLALLIVRHFSEWFLRAVWPRQRGAASAILIGKPPAASRFEHAIAAPGGDYRVAGYVATDRGADGDFLGSIDDLSAVIQE